MDYLSEANIPFTASNIRLDPAALEFIRNEKHTTTPQIYVGAKLLVEGGNKGLRALSREQILARVAALS